MGIAASCLYAFLLRRSNKAKVEWTLAQSQLPEHERTIYTREQLQDLGDKSPEFIYTI